MKPSMKITFLLTVFLVVLWSGCAKQPSDSRSVVVGVNQFMEHPLLDDVYKGLVDALKEQNFSEETGTKITLKNASGDQSIAVQINKQFVDQKVDLLVALGTPSAQSACQLTKSIPIVFGAITDPVAAGIAESVAHPGGNKTGTSDRWPYEKQIGLIKLLVPDAQKIGIVLNPGESNTEASMKYIRPLIHEHGMDIVEVPVANTSEVMSAARSLVGRCDAIMIPGDNTVIAAIGSMVKVANENDIPLFAGSTASVEKGALATYGNNYYEIGRTTGNIVAKILREKKDPGSIPVSVATEADLVLNLKAAKEQGVQIPEDLIQKAKKVFQ